MDLNAIHALNHIKHYACNQAKEMEKEQIMYAYEAGLWDTGYRNIDGEEYYNETYKSE
jgi:hypothetical protein